MSRRNRETDLRGEVYFEHIVIGRAVKVSAVHAQSGIEVSISGPRSTSQRELERVALQKLIRAMARGGERGR